MKAFIAFLLMLPILAFAKGSSHPKAGEAGASFVPIELAQKTMHFSSERIWQDTVGNILVCPLSAKVDSYPRKCEEGTKKYAWVAMTDLKIPGYEISGFSISFAGSHGYTQLMVYFRKKD